MFHSFFIILLLEGFITISVEILTMRQLIPFFGGSNQAAIPPSLLTVDYFKALAEHLNNSGLLIVNIISDPRFGDLYARHVFNTIHAVFPYCTISLINWEGASLANMIYVCPNVASDQTVYTDDLSTATLDFFNRKQVPHK